MLISLPFLMMIARWSALTATDRGLKYPPSPEARGVGSKARPTTINPIHFPFFTFRFPRRRRLIISQIANPKAQELAHGRCRAAKPAEEDKDHNGRAPGNIYGTVVTGNDRD